MAGFKKEKNDPDKNWGKHFSVCQGRICFFQKETKQQFEYEANRQNRNPEEESSNVCAILQSKFLHSNANDDTEVSGKTVVDKQR